MWDPWRQLPYSHERGLRLWSVSNEGGDERPLAEGRLRRAASHTSMWCIWDDKLVFLGSGPEGQPAFELFDPRTAERTIVTTLPADARPTRGVSVSPDGRWILYSQDDRPGRDIMLVDGIP